MKMIRTLIARRHESPKGFTLMELLVVITIIAILAALILSTAGFVQRKAARSRAETEVQALAAALESYKADMGDYPAATNGDPATPSATPGDNGFLVDALMPRGVTNAYNPLKKVYFEFNKSMLLTNGSTGYFVVDPFGEKYGYRYPGSPTNSGTNFFDLWSRCATQNTNQWVTNW